MSPPVVLAAVWACILGGLGLFFPFFSLYLRENAGLTGLQTGAVMAIAPLAGLVMQPVWGQVSDRSGSRLRVLRGLALCAAAGYAGLAWPRSFPGLAVATLALAVFAVALIPTLVGVTLALARERSDTELGRVRVWGTLGFGVTVGTFPFLLDAFQATGAAGRLGPAVGEAAEPGLAVAFPLAAVLVASGALLTRALPRGGAEALRAERGDWHQLLRHRPFLRLLGFTLVAFLFLQGPMALFPLLVSAQGGGLDAVSRMWILMLVLEVPLVAALARSVALLGHRGVIGVGMAAGGLRWAVSGFAPDLAWVTAVQVLHGVTVWGVVLGLPLYADAVVPERLRSTGQGLLAMIGVSLGGFLSSLTAGWLVDAVGATAPARVGGVGALLLAALVPFVLAPADGARAEAPAEAGAAARGGAGR